MPVTYFNVTEIAYDKDRMEHQLSDETGRNIVLDPDWTTLTVTAHGFHSFLYKSDIEFILIRTFGEVKFQRILPVDPNAGLASVEWDRRTGEQYYVFKVDPTQKIVVMGSPSVRFFRIAGEERHLISDKFGDKVPLETGKDERCRRPWEAEDIYQQRDMIDDETFPPEHLAEVARRFKAWRAMSTQNLFVYLLVPKRWSEAEEERWIENSVQFVEDVQWVL